MQKKIWVVIEKKIKFGDGTAKQNMVENIYGSHKVRYKILNNFCQETFYLFD